MSPLQFNWRTLLKGKIQNKTDAKAWLHHVHNLKLILAKEEFLLLGFFSRILSASHILSWQYGLTVPYTHDLNKFSSKDNSCLQLYSDEHPVRVVLTVMLEFKSHFILSPSVWHLKALGRKWLFITASPLTKSKIISSRPTSWGCHYHVLLQAISLTCGIEYGIWNSFHL